MWNCKIDFVGDICGDKCLTHDASECICGGTEFQRGNASYCCTPKDVPCRYENKTNGRNVICPKGKIIPWTSKCHGVCPSTAFNILAIKANCSFVRDDYCPSTQWVSKICNVNETDVNFYCENGISCPAANGRFRFRQCYKK